MNLKSYLISYCEFLLQILDDFVEGFESYISENDR